MNVDIYLLGGDNQTVAELAVEGTNPENLVINLNEDHSLDATNNLIIIVLPKYDMPLTDFEMEYYTDGVLYEWYWAIYNEYFGGPDG